MTDSSTGAGLAQPAAAAAEVSVKRKSNRELREEQNAQVREKNKGLAEARLDYLQEQVELFSNPQLRREREEEAKQRGKRRGGGRSKKRQQEEEEDEEEDAGEEVDYISKQPACITGEMRPYQIEGLRWMVSLYDRGSSMILADEMGLGKTLQSISLLGYLKFERKVSGPHIVIVPLAVLMNWEREFARWCPSLRVVSIHGEDAVDRKRQLKAKLVPNKFDVVLTTFEVLRIEKTWFKRFHYQFMVVDEAHKLKNEQSLTSQVCREVSSNFRLALTGTPLQNNLKELWALLNFLLPDIFRENSISMFQDTFELQDLKEDRVASRLHSILTPFMLRRLKIDAERSIPPKREIKLYCGMTELQSYWYKSVLSRDLQALNQLGASKTTTKLENLLMHLRKVCNHPYLFDGAEPGPPFVEGPHLYENSGKMFLLDKLLRKLHANGDRVLIFSQMTQMLDLLEDYLELRGYKYCRLDGSTKSVERVEQMDDFNRADSDKFCFLLSTRAGGLGINLQTANVVILFDSDWNPQMDLQAQDRAHRIGQTREVTVFRLITEGTVEEKIVERAEQKLFLDAVIVQQGNLKSKSKNLTKDDMASMIRFGAETIFRSGGVKVTDEDIDVILERGKARTEAARAKIQNDVQFSLDNFEIVEKTASFCATAPSTATAAAAAGKGEDLAPLLALAKAESALASASHGLGKRERKPPNFFAQLSAANNMSTLTAATSRKKAKLSSSSPPPQQPPQPPVREEEKKAAAPKSYTFPMHTGRTRQPLLASYFAPLPQSPVVVATATTTTMPAIANAALVVDLISDEE